MQSVPHGVLVSARKWEEATSQHPDKSISVKKKLAQYMES